MRRTIVALSLLTALAGASKPALAWDADGHRFIAETALQHLTPKARAALDVVLAYAEANPTEGCPVATLADAAVWPDCVRRKPGFGWLSPRHYDDIPLFGPVDKSKYCPEGKCATDGIELAIATLKDKSQLAPDHAIALYQIAHFVGDIHQPLHATDNNDRGGNEVKIIYLGQATHPSWGKQVDYNLHFVWDTMLFANALKRDTKGNEITALVNAHRAEWSKGNAQSWAEETHRVGVEFAYGRLPVKMTPNVPPADAVAIDQKYVDDSAPIVREQIAKASLRLAAVLNDALGH